MESNPASPCRNASQPGSPRAQPANLALGQVQTSPPVLFVDDPLRHVLGTRPRLLVGLQQRHQRAVDEGYAAL